ncbi:MAG TPA: ABC transporter substrate-binding protein [Stellaceae bacterium]|nr:ABC transporter substrate-binding protein [Stellaceae bacterium]
MKTRFDRREFAIGAAATGALAIAGPVGRARAQIPAIKIGSLLPRSGFEAQIGQHCQQAIEVGKSFLKARGYSLEVIDSDTQSSPEAARTEAEKLIRDGCNILTGAFDSAQSLAIAQVAEQRGIPFVVNIGADPAITNQGYKFIFRNFPTAVMLGNHGLELFGEIFKATGKTPKTAVYIHLNDSFGEAVTKGVHAFRDKVGLPFTIVDEIAYSPQTNDLSAEVAKAKATNAELAMVITRLNDAILLVREMVKQKWSPWGIISPGSPGMYQMPFFKALGKYANYCITNVPWLDPKQKMAKEFEAAFLKAYPEQICDIDAGFTFEGLLVCADAYKRAGSTKPQALVEALKATNITDRVMLGGPITFDEHGQNTNLPSAAVQDLKGKPTVVLPAANAVAKPVFPMPQWSTRT